MSERWREGLLYFGLGAAIGGFLGTLLTLLKAALG